MVALLREMVDIDSGSYNKPGIDAVGAVVQRFMAAQGIPVETLAPAEARRLPACRGAVGRTAGQCRRQHRADGPSRHRVPRWRGLAPAVHHPRWHRLRARRRRHEGGAGDELLRARRVREIRRRAGAAGRAVHRRRGDRQPGRPRGDRGRGAPRPRRVQQRARARVRQRGHRPQGRRVHGVPRHRQARRIPAATSPTASARSRNSRARSRRCTRSPISIAASR